MFYVKTYGKMQDIQDKETNTDELQGTRELKKKPRWGLFCVCCTVKTKKAKCRKIKTQKQERINYKERKIKYLNKPVGARFSASVQMDPGAYPPSHIVGVTIHSHLAPRLKKE